MPSRFPTAPSAPTIDSTGASISGEVHLWNLRNYIRRITQLVSTLAPFVNNFTPSQRAGCHGALRSAYILLTVVGPMTALTRAVFDSLTVQQHVALVHLMDELKEWHAAAVELAVRLAAIVEDLAREDAAWELFMG